MKEVIVAYVPVLHEGYQRFFASHPQAKTLFLLDKSITDPFVPLKKDLRALDPEIIRSSLLGWKRFDEIIISDEKELKSLASSSGSIIMPDEDVMHEIQAKYFPKTNAKFDSIFLRWDKHKSTDGKPVEANQTISTDSKDQEIIQLLKKEAGKSADFWRHIAAAVVKDGKIILQTHNKHVPHEQQPYLDGDPRSDFHKGINVELATSFHCEAALIAEAARLGQSLEGASIYVTTFPCPPCAKLVAFSGIKKLYYADGYGVLDGERVLKSKGVEIVFVKTV
jgi:dCMP deaminase